MASIQSILAIGAMAILALISFNFNSSVIQNSTVEIENKVYLTAFSLADDLIEEIKQKAFDHQTVQFRSINPEELTHPKELGPDAGETYPNFNDIDDYNGFTRNVSLPHAEGYTVTCKVSYADPNNPEQTATAQTFYKLVEVSVSSPFLSWPVKLSFVFTLHSKMV